MICKNPIIERKMSVPKNHPVECNGCTVTEGYIFDEYKYSLSLTPDPSTYLATPGRIGIAIYTLALI